MLTGGLGVKPPYIGPSQELVFSLVGLRAKGGTSDRRFRLKAAADIIILCSCELKPAFLLTHLNDVFTLSPPFAIMGMEAVGFTNLIKPCGGILP
jgi:hypothetical protein